ncbi:MAG: 3-phosphoshikimate 1-carboxyvinyltransferase [Nannocystis sp.]|nr:3-phosphoshikimate 1-carboxyvinyltransferase [Nannocystis sp.]MBA3547449.1 3-phosphoshikimate 1-carboxyvinyltransferase [Nannocystis sp.]
MSQGTSSSIHVRPPASPVCATLSPPGSKSLTNRALILAALASGRSTLRGCLDSEDTQVMLRALERFGLAPAVNHDHTIVSLTGNGGPPESLAEPTRAIEVATAGTAARFLTAVLAAAPLVTRVDGSPRMRERPMEGLLAALREQGATIVCLGHDDLLPIEIHGARLRGGEIRLQRPPSSQFISALILAAALADAPTRIVLEQGTPARPYVDMTLVALRDFGGDADWHGPDTIAIRPSPLRARDYTVEPDASAASYLLALPAIFGGRVTVPALGRSSVQGDARFCEVLARMGAATRQDAHSTTVTGTGGLHGAVLDLTDMPDMTLTAAVLALHARGRTEIHGVEVLRHHESDRLAAGACELRKLGAIVEELPGGLIIDPPAQVNQHVAIDTYLDHRMAMAFSLAGQVEIRDPACVAKTFPRYFEVLADLGMIAG